MENLMKNFETPNGVATMEFFQYEEKPENCEGLVAKAIIGEETCLIIKSVVFAADDNNKDLYCFELQEVNRFDYNIVYSNYNDMIHCTSLEEEKYSVLSVVEAYFKTDDDIDMMWEILEEKCGKKS